MFAEVLPDNTSDYDADIEDEGQKDSSDNNCNDLESFEGDGLPDLNNESSDYDVYNINDDYSVHDKDTTITVSDSDSDVVLLGSSSPLYQNQEGDPQIQEYMYQEFLASLDY